MSYQIEKEEENLKKTEHELEIERTKYSEIILKKEQLELEKRDNYDLEVEEKLDNKIRDYELELNDITTRIENGEETLEFQLGKVNELTQRLSSRPDVVPEQLLFNNEKLNRNQLNYQIVLRALLAQHMNTSLETFKIKDKINQTVRDTAEIKKRLEESEQKSKLAELQYQINLTKLTREYERNQMLLMKQQPDEEDEENDNDKENTTATDVTNPSISMDSKMNPPQSITNLAQARQRRSMHQAPDKASTAHGGLSRNNSSKQLDSIDRNSPGVSLFNNGKRGNNESLTETNKRLEKTISDMIRKQQASDKSIETLKRKCELLQQRCDQVKKVTAKAGLPKEDLTASILSTSITTPSPQTAGITLNIPTASLLHQTINTSSFGNLNIGGMGFLKNKSDKAIKSTFQIADFKEKRREEKEKGKGGMGTPESKNSRPVTATDGAMIDENKPIVRRTTTMVTTTASINNSKGITTNYNMEKVIRHQKSNSIMGLKKTSPSGRNSGTRLSFHEPPAKPNTGISIQDSTDEFKADDLTTEGENVERTLNYEDNQGLNYDNNFWKCQASIEAHGHAVYCVKSHGNMIYSSSNKTIKVWSLDTLDCISEIEAHNGMIKTMAVAGNVLLTASGGTVKLWDLVSLQNIKTLKSNLEDIKALHVCGDMLICGGKSSLTSGGIAFWDLKNLDNQAEDMEKNQDVFSFASWNQTLYYGSRNHQVRRIDLATMESLAPLMPPHFDAVTSLSIVGGHLVSGSRDKILKLWSLDYPNSLKFTSSYAHQDWINVTETNVNQDILYSGSKDGTIKIWGVANNKLRCMSDINGHSQAVNSICKLYDENESMFVTGSSDKSIKIWKPLSNDIMGSKGDDDDSGNNSLRGSMNLQSLSQIQGFSTDRNIDTMDSGMDFETK
jgi:WD40 repeat protein